LLDLFAELQIEVIIVTPNAEATADVAEPRIRLLIDRGGGTYNAYAQGLANACGEYVWLLGDDDYPLDAAASIVADIKRGTMDLLVAPVVMSSGRIYRPKRSTFMLLLRNWCQQGVIYRRSLLMRHRFYRRLRVQADHYVNVLLRADAAVRTKFVAPPICVFGVHGLSSRGGDVSYRSLRMALARRALSWPGFVAFHLVVTLATAVKRVVERKN
jgi:glycosyltransferase involved in cell wall biosynthesis